MSDAATLNPSPRSTAGLGVHPDRLGMWIFLAVVSMLFAAFLSAYIVRRAGTDWVAVPLPGILWVNTSALLVSSCTLALAGGALRRRREGLAARWLLATSALGVLFLAGQALAWRRLVAWGVYVPTSPHSSFFYIFTGLHGLHLLAGVVLLLWATYHAARGRRPAAARRRLVEIAATYWHFMGALWVLLFIVLATV